MDAISLLLPYDSVRMRVSALAAVGHKVEHPLPLRVGERAIGIGVADFGEQLLGDKSAAHCHGHTVLHQYIKRNDKWLATFKFTVDDGLAHCGKLN